MIQFVHEIIKDFSMCSLEVDKIEINILPLYCVFVSTFSKFTNIFWR